MKNREVREGNITLSLYRAAMYSTAGFSNHALTIKTTFNGVRPYKVVCFLHIPDRLLFSEAYQRKAQTFLDKHKKEEHYKLNPAFKPTG